MGTGVGTQETQLQRENKTSKGWPSWRESPGQEAREGPGDASAACPRGGGQGLLTRRCCSSLRAPGRELWAALELLSLRGGKPGSWREQLPKASGARRCVPAGSGIRWK